MTPATLAPEDEIQSPLAHLTEEQIDELAKEFDAIHDEVYSEPRSATAATSPR